ncbi:MAG: hypothetical protein K0S65_3385 [Labilithrix sp.]|nr:hypothetical protein [Labilithrix sp.]
MRLGVVPAIGLFITSVVVPLVACSGPDQGLITFSERPSEGSTESSPEPSESTSSPAPTSTSTGAVNTVFASDAYPAVSAACASCHLAGTSGAPIFFGANAAATYPLFKQRNYHLPNSIFVTKGVHLGPALTTDQRAAVDRWVAAEGGGADGG